MKMEFNEKLQNHEERIARLERKLEETLDRSKQNSPDARDFVFSNKKKSHSELLEELLKSDYCHSKNGLSLGEILKIFEDNNRPVIPKKIRDLLAVWKIRKKIEAIKLEAVLRYFWIENE